jgi:hypothetical protein
MRGETPPQTQAYHTYCHPLLKCFTYDRFIVRVHKSDIVSIYIYVEGWPKQDVHFFLELNVKVNVFLVEFICGIIVYLV